VRVRTRTATPADADAVDALVERAYAHYVERIGRRPGPMDDDHKAEIEAQEIVLLEDEDGTLVGVLVRRAEPGHLLVHNVAIDPAHQGRGHGRALLEHAEAEAAERGLPELRLYTHVRMTENIAMYERAGWIEYDRRGEAGFQRVFFRKPLG
jgi:ribosomal protein S18 acetylase RimI-like enzyme